MTKRNVLVLCTGNSARSILGEVLFRDRTGGRYQGYSAGSTPKGAPHPDALACLEGHGHSIEGLSSKSWDVFAEAGGPEIHIAITVCDNAAAETCPFFPGAPIRAHWGLPDPAYVEPLSARQQAFEDTYAALSRRIDALLELPEDAGEDDLRAALNRIGEMA